jgi:hypothetical protein
MFVGCDGVIIDRRAVYARGSTHRNTAGRSIKIISGNEGAEEINADDPLPEQFFSDEQIPEEEPSEGSSAEDDESIGVDESAGDDEANPEIEDATEANGGNSQEDAASAGELPLEEHDELATEGEDTVVEPIIEDEIPQIEIVDSEGELLDSASQESAELTNGGIPYWKVVQGITQWRQRQASATGIPTPKVLLDGYSGGHVAYPVSFKQDLNQKVCCHPTANCMCWQVPTRQYQHQRRLPGPNERPDRGRRFGGDHNCGGRISGSHVGRVYPERFHHYRRRGNHQ